VPQDIPSASHAKNIPAGGKSRKVDKPPSPSFKKSTSKPPCLGNAKGFIGAEGAPPSPTIAESRRDTAHDLHWPDPTERSGASLLYSQLYGLGTPSGHQPGEGSSVPGSREQPRQYSCVTESLCDNPKFSQAAYHIGRYVIAPVNTEAQRERIKALYSSMKTISELINISMHILSYLFDLKFDSSV
jgi:hypothetical protein